MPTNFFSCFLNFFTFLSSSTHCFAEHSLFCRELIVLPNTHCFAESSLFCRALIVLPSLISLHRTYASELLLFHTPPRRRALSLYTKPTSPSLYCSICAPRRRAFTVPYMPHVAGPLLFHICPTSPSQASQPPRQSPKARC